MAVTEWSSFGARWQRQQPAKSPHPLGVAGRAQSGTLYLHILKLYSPRLCRQRSPELPRTASKNRARKKYAKKHRKVTPLLAIGIAKKWEKNVVPRSALKKMRAKCRTRAFSGRPSNLQNHGFACPKPLFLRFQPRAPKTSELPAWAPLWSHLVHKIVKMSSKGPIEKTFKNQCKV